MPVAWNHRYAGSSVVARWAFVFQQRSRPRHHRRRDRSDLCAAEHARLAQTGEQETDRRDGDQEPRLVRDIEDWARQDEQNQRGEQDRHSPAIHALRDSSDSYIVRSKAEMPVTVFSVFIRIRISEARSGLLALQRRQFDSWAP